MHNQILSWKSQFAHLGHKLLTFHVAAQHINPLNTKRRLLYLKTQFVPRSKHFSSRL